MVRCVVGLIALLITGCRAEPTPALTPVASSQPGLVIPHDRILVQFRSLDCVCNLGDIEYALLELPEVSALQWDFSANRVWLIFLDEPRPTDDAIRACVRNSPLQIKGIHRP